MPSIHAHGNTNVSKVWFLFVGMVAVFSFIAWDASRTMMEIVVHAEETRAGIEDVLQR